MSEVISRVTDIDVEWISSTSLLVIWKVERIPSDFQNYKINVLKSYDQDGEYINISGDLSYAFDYLDDKVKSKHTTREIYYKVRIEDTDGVISEYGPSHLRDDPDLIAKDIIRRNNLLLRTKVGRLSNIYRSRTIGTRCPRCWDPIKKRKSVSNCPDCFNTGFLKGFFDPVQTYVNYNPPEKAITLANLGEIDSEQTVALVSNYPRVQPRDVVVDKDRRWRVVQRKQTEKLGILVHQILQLEKINLSDIEYKLT